METIQTDVKIYNIGIPKQDYMLLRMSIKENGVNVELGENDLLFMTIRTSANSEDYIIQKSLNDGITYNSELKKYEIEILSQDTKDLQYGKNYGYDITIYYNGNKPKQKAKGIFKITDKFTLNEVV